MKIVVTADVHVHPFRICSRDGGHDRLLDGLGALRQSLELARRERAAWIMAGDFKLPKTQWPQEALTGSHAVLREYGDVEKVMVAGNHDAIGLGGSGLAPFKDVARVIEEPSAVYIGDGEHLVLFAPWNADPARVAELQSQTSSRPAPFVGHAFLAGVVLGPEDSKVHKGVPSAAYGKFPVAFFGDVHKGQWRRAPEANKPERWTQYSGKGEDVRGAILVRAPKAWGGEVFYPGSPYQQNWGERSDPPKGALLVDLGTGKVQLIPFKSPRFIQIELYEGEKFDGGGLEGNFARIVVDGRPTPELLERLQASGTRSLQIIVRKRERRVARADVHAGMPRRKLLEGYVAAHPPEDGVDRDKTIEIMERLMDDA